jgi:hypothetical protein
MSLNDKDLEIIKTSLRYLLANVDDYNEAMDFENAPASISEEQILMVLNKFTNWSESDAFKSK